MSSGRRVVEIAQPPPLAGSRPFVRQNGTHDEVNVHKYTLRLQNSGPLIASILDTNILEFLVLILASNVIDS